jgi:hypothetical protein
VRHANNAVFDPKNAILGPKSAHFAISFDLISVSERGPTPTQEKPESLFVFSHFRVLRLFALRRDVIGFFYPKVPVPLNFFYVFNRGLGLKWVMVMLCK